MALKKKILITGANGFVGSKLSQYLCASGHFVVESVRDPVNSNQVKLDLNWSEIPKNYFKDIDIVIHCAANVHNKNSTESIFTQNTDFTELMLERVIEDKVKRFIFISTVGVFGKDFSQYPISDQSELNPKNDYSRSKLQAEKILKLKLTKSDVFFNILRLPLIIGANAPGTYGTLLKGIDRGFPFPFKGATNRRSIILIDDLARCLDKIIKDDIYINDAGILCHPTPLNTAELILYGGKVLSKKVRLFRFPKMVFLVLLKVLGQEKVYHQAFDSLEFVLHPKFRKFFNLK